MTRFHRMILVAAFGVSATFTQAVAAPSGLMVEFQRAVDEFDQGQQAKTTQPDRARQLLGLAAQRFESLVAAGVRNGYLEYNLGNTYLQLNDIGRAILHYRRAQRMIPRDPLLLENLGVARGRSLLNIPPARKSAVYRNLFFWHYQTSPSTRYATALLAYVLFWVLIALRAFFPRRGWTIAAMFSALVCLAAGGSLMIQRWHDRNFPDAVVTAGDVVVYKGPADTYQKQFEQSLQPGVEVTVREDRGEWRRIELSDGGSGWVPRNSIELVPLQENPDNQVSLLPS